MVDDVLLSPEEQDERAKKWLKDNGLALAVGIGLGLAAVTGYNYYQDMQVSKAEQASALYAEALQQIEASTLSNIDAQVNALKADYPSTPYSAKAVLLKAKQLAASDLDAAVKELAWVAENAPEASLQHTARVRQAKILLAQGELDAAAEIASAHQSALGFESFYHEILADVAVAKGDHASAREHYQKSIDALAAGGSAYAQVLSIKIDRLPASPEASE